MDFQVGDRVLSHAPKTVYMITYKGWEGYVTRVFPEEPGCIRVCEEPNVDEGFDVENKYFENLSAGERENITVSYDELLEMVFGSESN